MKKIITIISCLLLYYNSNAQQSSNIVGGSSIDIKKVPWQVSLQVVSSSGGTRHFSGGIIIAPQWVIAAAHSLYLSVSGPITYIKAGSTDQTNTSLG